MFLLYSSKYKIGFDCVIFIKKYSQFHLNINKKRGVTSVQ